MSSKKLTSPNDSLQQSTREPSTRSGETSLDASSFSLTRRFLTSSAQMGGGSYKSFVLDHLARMHADIESTTRKLELEKRRLHNLDKQLVLAESEWNTKRQRKYKPFQTAQEEGVQSKTQHVKHLERQLWKATEELNKGNSDNESLRAQIDQLRKERLLLNTVFDKQKQDIQSNKSTMEQLKMSMNEARHISEEAKQSNGAIKKMLERERRAFKDVTKKLQQAMDEEKKIQKEQEHLNRIAQQQRELEKAEEPDGEKGEKSRKGAVGFVKADEEEAFEEPQMHARILKLSFLNSIQRRHIKQHQKNIEVFEQAFATIKSTTGISDIEEIVKIFIVLEQRNFSLLTYVNQLNRDIESLEIRNRDMANQLTQYTEEEAESSRRKQVALSELSAQIQKVRTLTEEKEGEIEDSVAALEETRPLIWNIVQYLKQEMPALVTAGFEGEAPPMKCPVPENFQENTNSCLLYIEESILQFRVCLSTDPQTVAQHLRPQPPKVPASTMPRAKPLDSQIPTYCDEEEDDDEILADRVRSRKELKVLAHESLRKKRLVRKQHGRGEDRRTDTGEDGGFGGGDTLPLPRPRDHSTLAVGRESDAGIPFSKTPSYNKNSADTGLDATREEDLGGKRKAAWWRTEARA